MIYVLLILPCIFFQIASAGDEFPICHATINNIKRAGNPEPNEDRILFYKSEETAPLPIRILGVLDGHGGPEASSYLKNNLGHLITRLIFKSMGEKSVKNYQGLIEMVKSSINKAILHIDRIICTHKKFPSGSTASFVVHLPSHAFVVNVGDSRTLVLDEGQVIGSTKDHDPADPEEREYVESHGGHIFHFTGVARVFELAMSRSIGDCSYKMREESNEYTAEGFLRPTPDIQVYPVKDRQQFLSATDGLFTRRFPMDEIQNLLTRVYHANKVRNACNLLARTAREQKFSKDDITVVIG